MVIKNEKIWKSGFLRKLRTTTSFWRENKRHFRAHYLCLGILFTCLVCGGWCVVFVCSQLQMCSIFFFFRLFWGLLGVAYCCLFGFGRLSERWPNPSPFWCWCVYCCYFFVAVSFGFLGCFWFMSVCVWSVFSFFFFLGGGGVFGFFVWLFLCMLECFVFTFFVFVWFVFALFFVFVEVFWCCVFCFIWSVCLIWKQCFPCNF